MLSGSIAMGVYVMPRATRDIDFIVHLEYKDIESIVNYFSEGYYCSKGAVEDAVARQSIFNIIDHASGYKADFVVLKNNDPYRVNEFGRKQVINFYDVNIFVVSPEDLLLSKLIWIQEWQSAVQMEDIKNLSALPQLQMDYINFWIKNLQLNSFNLIKND